MKYAIDNILTDKRLLGRTLGDPASWVTWFAVLKAAFALPLSAEEKEIFDAIAGGRPLPKKRVRELWVIAGRRSGKSRIAAALAVYYALFEKHPKLVAGERGLVLVLAASREQARTVFEYTLAFLNESAVLKKEINTTTASEIRLKNGITIAIHSNSFRTVRGRTLLVCIADELSFWRDESSATPDKEVYSAVLPSLITTNGMWVGISSPYRKAGLMYAKHKQFYNADSDDTLVVQGSTLTFNRTLDENAVAAQQEADPEAGKSEWEAQFRSDLVGFLDDAIIDIAVDHARPLELPPQSGKFYRAFVDVAGGTVGGDAYCIGVAHREDGRFVVDLVRGRAGPFEPQEVTEQYAALCKEYRIGSVTGDAYAAQWVKNAWQKCGMHYITSEIPASQIYLESLPLWTRGLAVIPNHPTLLRELRMLERTPTRMGKDLVTHPRNCHDDHANVCCGVLYSISNYLGYSLESGWLSDSPADPNSEQARKERDRQYRAQLAQRIFVYSNGQCFPRV
jgi:hypothetical protein